MKTRDRITAALAGGAWGAFIAWFAMSTAPRQLAKDFSWPWRAARVLLEGHDPYQVLQATGAYPFNIGLFYPLPAAILAIPFAPFPPAAAGALFVGLSSAALGWALSKDSPHRLLLFASAPFCMAALLGQWSPILTAAALLPALQFVGAGKPNIGLVAWAYRPSWYGVAGVAALCLLSFVIQPDWAAEWRESLRAAPRYRGPALSLIGAFTLLGLLRWRRREGRLFVAMACVPQLSLFYDQLPLWLIPSTVRRALVLTVSSWVAWFAWYPSAGLTSSVAAAKPWILALIYAPALVMLLLLPVREEPGDEGAPKESPQR
jgi:hypothetical protein